MNDDYDRDELLAAMYQDDDAEPKKEIHIDPTGFNRTRKIHVGAIVYEVPTIDYVTRLEQMLTKQAKIIDQLRQHVSKLERFVSGTKKFIKGQTRHITEIKHDLDNKLDIRE